MKKTLFSMGAILLMYGITRAQTYESVYRSLPFISTEKLVHVDENTDLIEQTQHQYEDAFNTISNIMMEEGNKMSHARARIQQVQTSNRPTQAQQQASMAIGQDMMAALAAAGVDFSKLDKMSEEEIAAILMPAIAQKNGLTVEEMQAMQGMSDKEAEAYMKQKGRAERVKNSEYAQYAPAMQDMKPALNISDADYAKIDQIKVLSDRINEDANTSNMYESLSREEFNLTREMEEQYEKTYQPRIDAIMQEFVERINQEPAWKTTGGNGIKTPAYGKDYYARMNAVIEEYNRACIAKWEKSCQKDVETSKKMVETQLTLYEQREKIFNTLTSEDAKNVAQEQMSSNGIHSYIMFIINYQQKRLSLPLKYHYTMPEYFGGMG